MKMRNVILTYKVMPSALSLMVLSLLATTLQAQVSQFYGTTSDGGQDKEGAIYKTDGNGENFELLHHFINLDIQDVRHVGLCEATDGKLYGASVDGGDFADGTIFEHDPATGVTTVLYSFDNATEGRSPFGGLIQASDGLLYGMLCYGGPTDDGQIFSYDIATATLTFRHQFDGTTGERPQSTLMEASDGLLYGVTRFGGAFDDGVIFSFDPSSDTYTMHFEFEQAVSGDRPYAGLTESSIDSLLYGVTFTGGTHDHGVLYSFDPATAAYTVLVEMLDSVSGRKPYGTMIQASDDLLYGTAFKGGVEDKGVIFSYNTLADSFAIVQSLTTAIGENPQGGLFEASDSLLYGTTDVGGANDLGTMFSFDPVGGNAAAVIDYDLGMGYSSYATPIEAADGKIYVCTREGASGGNGSLMTYEPATFTTEIVAPFNLAVDGRDPLGGLLLASDSLLYGVTHKGGNYDDGTLFRIDPISGNFEKLFDFKDTVSGSRPRSTLIQASDGLLYGTALNGGIFNDGTIYSYDIATNTLDKRVDLHTAVSGKRPAGALTEVFGQLYGITELGGATQGTIFQFDPTTDVLLVKHNFDAVTGLNAQGSLELADDGLLYGVADIGGPGGEGVLYSFDPATDTYVIRHSFDALLGTGATPRCQPVQAADGLLYGATAEGGPSSEGIFYSYDISSGSYAVLGGLDPAVFGEVPIGKLVEGLNGNIYGVTNSGGPGGGGGTLFEYNFDSSALSVKQDFAEPVADDPWMAPIEIIVCYDVFEAAVDTACNSYTTPWGAVVTASGIYSDTIETALGCDSVFVIDVTIFDLDDAVTTDDSSLTAVQSGATYQWLDCDNGNMPITGATGQTFVPAGTGNYAVQITNGPCSTISACTSFTISVGLDSPVPFEASLYPNPVADFAVLELPLGSYQLGLMDLQGSLIWESIGGFGQRFEIPVEQLGNGIYLLRVVGENGERTLKLFKQ